VVAQSRDLAQVISISSRGGAVTARIYDGGELRPYAVTADGIAPLPRNWPRLIHEGNGAAMITGPLNFATALALLTLLVTALVSWGRRAAISGVIGMTYTAKPGAFRARPSKASSSLSRQR
jgi:uncharacterized iron-regulated membrane protein